VPKEYKYKAFISYAHTDKRFVKSLHRSIENYKIPKTLRQKHPHLPKNLKRSIFRDDEELGVATSLSDTLKTALEDSEKLIVICSPSSVKSKWVKEEVRYFQSLQREASIFNVIKKGKLTEVLPNVFKEEPLAINLQHDKKKGLIKIIASLLDVDFADLWRREQREALKRFVLASLVIVSFIIMGVYLFAQSIAISSNIELEEIKDEILLLEHEAKKVELSNTKRYEISQRLKALEEMKKLKEETLKWFGMLKGSVISKAKEAYDQEGAQSALRILESLESLAEDELYAKKNMLRAKLYIEMREYDEADRFYQKAIGIDNSYENVYDYVLFLMEQNQLEQAKSFLEQLEQYTLLEHQRANVLNRLGIVYRQSKRFVGAKRVYTEALILREKLTKEDPKIHKNDLAWTYNNLGILHEHSKEFQLAEKHHLKALALRKELLKEQGDEYAYFVSCSMHNLGELYKSSNNIEKAENFLLEVLKTRRELFRKNPKKLMHPLASTLHELGTLYLHTSRVEESENFYEEALKLRRILAKNNPKAYKFVLADTLNGFIKLYKKMGKLDQVLYLEKELKAFTIGEKSAT
jgi:tetratricopeptide (TPR) repeat protein